MKYRITIPALCFAGLLIVALAWWVAAGRGGNADDADSPPVAERTARADQAAISADPADIDPSQDGATILANEIRAMSQEDAVARISGILASGRDFETGHEFTLDADGNLTGAPTLRTMLLDELATIDPAAAARISRDILASPTTADEWAIALRNIGRVQGDAEAHTFLRTKTEELINNPEWQAAPSIGYLNAFDVLVHTEAVESAPLLSTLIQNKDRSDLAHAAFLTLDRLVQRQPAAMIDTLATDNALVASRPEMTAQQIARADLRDGRQRDLVAGWLLSPDRTATELNAFAGVFPNHNQFVSNNLLTQSTPIPGPELAAHDREVLEIVVAWQDDPAFQMVEPQINTMIERLAGFTSQQTQDPR